MTSTDKFIGYLVSVECKNLFYQGIVANIDPNKAIIQLKNCFQNGIQCGSKLIEIKTKDIENIEILADPQNALNFLNPKLLNDLSNGSATTVNSTDNGTKSSKTTSQTTNATPAQAISTNNDKKTQPLKVNSSKNNLNSISPSSVSPPSYTNGYHQYNESSKRKQSHNGNGYSNGNGHDYSNNENCFMSINVEAIKEDFDFEQNLALFDKDAFYEEIEGHSKPVNTNTNEEPLNAYDSLIKQLNSNNTNGNNNTISSNHNNSNVTADTSKTFSNQSNQRYHQISVANLFSSTQTASANTKTPNNNTNSLILPPTPSSNTLNQSLNQTKNYRYDEMVLDTGEPFDLQQIQIPSMNSKTNKRYVTDDGVILPCIDAELRKRLFEQSYKHGFSKERQIECMGRCCVEMALQLVGGPLRFSPKNNHQKPSILVLANNQDLQGSYALCTARLLSIRGCKIYLFISKGAKEDEFFQNELSLFDSIDPPRDTFLNSVDDIKNLQSIDLIINSIDSTVAQTTGQLWYKNLVKYIENCKASVLSIDPCCEGSAIQSKWCVIPVLPLDMSVKCGRVYLCDLGFTKNMFQSVNIKYKSPFGAKFLIPLYND